MKFAELLDRFKTLKALVVGDVMLDEYVLGKATRISPEAPVMVVKHVETRRVPGGAANVARNLAALGAATRLIGVVGDDEAGLLLDEELKKSGLSSAMVKDPDRKTTRKTRVLADHAHQVIRIDFEDELPLNAEIEGRLLELIESDLGGANVLVLSDYLKGGVSTRLAREAVARAKALGVPVVVNPKPRSAADYAGADLISLNRVEAAEALGIAKGLSDGHAEVAAANLRDKLGSPSLVTLGESGMVAASTGRICRIQAPRVEVYDTAGAGDTVVATAALGIAAIGFEKSVFELAAQTSACVVRHTGVVTPSECDLAAIRAL